MARAQSSKAGVAAKSLAKPQHALEKARRHLEADELDDARAIVDAYLSEQPKDTAALALRREILDGYLWRMVRRGEASWSGGKPKGSKDPVKLTPGPSITELIHDAR